MPDYRKRIDTLRRTLKATDGFLVTDMNNVRYLTGFSGSSGFALITMSESIFVTDFRYAGQSIKEISDPWEVVIEKKSRTAAIKRISRKTGIRRLCIESSASYEFFKSLSALNVKDKRGVVERQRETKDREEINSIKEAVRRAESAFLEVRPYIKAGIKEKAVALRLEERLKKKRCRRIPFDIIVASGTNSALPHAGVTDKKLEPGDLVIIDWGGEADGYFSDMTRTLLVKGNGSGRKKEIYRLVLDANLKGIRKISKGMVAGEIDSTARDVIKNAGYGEYFGHALGHGVGLQVHELPLVRSGRKVRIREGMVFTVEPGIYMPGLGGVRIEDMVSVGKSGAELLTTLPKKLEIIS
jgi:Xaa-Pro aminopeptidase